MTDNTGLDTFLADKNLLPSHVWVAEMQEKYPYFITPRLLLLQRGKGEISDEEYHQTLSSVALQCSDRKDLALQMGEDVQRFINFYPEEEKQKTPDTTSTIDSFLDKYGNTSDKEIAAIENAIFNPTPEYALTMKMDERATSVPKTEQDALIDSFLSKDVTLGLDLPNEPEQPVEPETSEEAPTEPQVEFNTTFSESLATVYIRQGKYAKAFDILTSVKENSSEPLPHINDQLRFLRKLISISK